VLKDDEDCIRHSGSAQVFEDLASVIKGPVMEHEAQEEYGSVVRRLWVEVVVHCTPVRKRFLFK
jgi:hypothetical protein